MKPDPPFSAALDRALRLACEAHAGQNRKGSSLPYAQHLFAVALIIQRLGFDDEVVQAAMLHDILEDTPITPARLELESGPTVAALVRCCTEVKLDENGQKRPWLARKQEHATRLATAPIEARAIALADKLHNLVSMNIEIAAGRHDWRHFNADRAAWIATTRQSIELISQAEPRDTRLDLLASHALAALSQIETPPTAPAR